MELPATPLSRADDLDHKVREGKETQVTTTEDREQVERRGVMQRLTELCVRYVERLMPDPYLFAVILTALAISKVLPYAVAGVLTWLQRSTAALPSPQ